MTGKTTMHATTVERTGEAPKHHFFLSSAAEWRVGYDLEPLIRSFRKANYPFNVWLVPGTDDAHYEIEYYAPQAEGATWLAFYGFTEQA